MSPCRRIAFALVLATGLALAVPVPPASGDTVAFLGGTALRGDDLAGDEAPRGRVYGLEVNTAGDRPQTLTLGAFVEKGLLDWERERTLASTDGEFETIRERNDLSLSNLGVRMHVQAFRTMWLHAGYLWGRWKEVGTGRDGTYGQPLLGLRVNPTKITAFGLEYRPYDFTVRERTAPLDAGATRERQVQGYQLVATLYLNLSTVGDALFGP